MANPTTNYGWPMPTSTDLVTDLPADFAAFGQPVDTTLKALNPETTLGDIAYRSATSNTNTRLGIGTNGQVLAVSGGVPAWTTTADVTPLTTKGDLFTFTTVDARLAVGADGTTIVADSSTATGLKWATPSSGSTFVGCLAVNRGSQPSIANATYTAVSLNVEIYDTDSIHSTVTNTSRFTIPAGKGGYWLFYATLGYNDLLGNYQVKFYKNGAATGRAIFPSNTNASYSSGSSITEIISCSAADYIELYTYQTGGGSETLQVSSTDDFVFMGCTYLGA